MMKKSSGQQHILVFDVGTSAVKTALFSEQLSLVAVETTEYPLITAGETVEAAPLAYLAAMQKGVRKLPRRNIAAIGITTQGETLVPVDAAGTPLGNAIVWLDARAEKQAAALQKRIGGQRFYETTGLPEITGALPLAKLLWYAERQKQIYQKTDKFLLLEDYLRFYMTAEAATNRSLATSTGWLDIRSGAYWDEALEAAGIDKTKLPVLLGSGEAAGTLQSDAAKALGLRCGIPVFTGAMDQTAAALAVGAGKTAPSAKRRERRRSSRRQRMHPCFRRGIMLRSTVTPSMANICICPSAIRQAWRSNGSKTSLADQRKTTMRLLHLHKPYRRGVRE